MTDAELDLVTADVVVVGDTANTGGMKITDDISPANTARLELETAGSISDTANKIVTVQLLAMTAGTGIGQGGIEIQTNVDNLEATTNSGGIFIDEQSGLTIGGVNATLNGLSVTTSGAIDVSTFVNSIDVTEAVANLGGGNVSITAEDDINATAPISTIGTGDITLIAEPGGGGGNFNSSGAGTVTAVTGDIAIEAADNVNVGAAVSTGGLGLLTIEADRNSGGGGSFTNTAGGTLTTDGNPIRITAQDVNIGETLTSTNSSVIFEPGTLPI